MDRCVFAATCTINHMKEEAWWRDHIWTLSELLASCDGHPSITNGFPLQRRRRCGPLIFPMILTWISWWCETPRRSSDVAVMIIQLCLINITCEVVTYNSIIVTYLWNYHIDNYFTLNRNVHSYDTRQCQLLHVPPCPSNLTKRGVKYRGVKIWNQLLGQEIDIDVSQPVFKHNCKRIIFAGLLDYIWANLKCCYGMKSVYYIF